MYSKLFFLVRNVKNLHRVLYVYKNAWRNAFLRNFLELYIYLFYGRMISWPFCHCTYETAFISAVTWSLIIFSFFKKKGDLHFFFREIHEFWFNFCLTNVLGLDFVCRNEIEILPFRELFGARSIQSIFLLSKCEYTIKREMILFI